MAVRYLCDSCGYRGFDPNAGTADEVLCEQCSEPVLSDPDTAPPTMSAGQCATDPRQQDRDQ